MLENSQTIRVVTLTKAQEKTIEQLCDTAAATIAKVKATDSTSINTLLQFMNSVNTFKTDNSSLDEQYLGSFAHTKETTTSTSFSSAFASPARQTHVALFFHLLKNYNNEMCITEKKNPTLEDWQAHKWNEAIDVDNIIGMGKNIGIHVLRESIDRNKAPFKPIAQNIALTPFITLIANIEALMAEKRLITLKTLADLVYVNGAVETPQD